MTYKYETVVLYEKVGRRYVPRYGSTFDMRNDDMKVGEFRLTYCHTDGGRRYEYNVTPATAAWAAAAMIARQVMEDAMHEAAAAKPSEPREYTKKQQAIIKKYRAEMAAAGGNFPNWWSVASPREIAKAAIDALENYRP